MDHSSMLITLILYFSFPGEFSRPMSDLLEFHRMEEHPGSHCPLPWSLQVSSRLTHAFSTSFTSDHFLRETKGSAETLIFPNGSKRSHPQREWMWSRVKKLLLRLWKFHLSYLLFPVPGSYLEWHFVAGLNVKWSFCGISYQLRRIGWFWVQLFPSCGTYLRQVKWITSQEYLIHSSESLVYLPHPPGLAHGKTWEDVCAALCYPPQARSCQAAV